MPFTAEEAISLSLELADLGAFLDKALRKDESGKVKLDKEEGQRASAAPHGADRQGRARRARLTWTRSRKATATAASYQDRVSRLRGMRQRRFPVATSRSGLY